MYGAVIDRILLWPRSPAVSRTVSHRQLGRVFAATADLAALAGWVSHDGGRYAIAQRFWKLRHVRGRGSGRRDRGVETSPACRTR